MPEQLRLGTRGSQLALWQANAVAAHIVATGGPPSRIVTIKTSGDRLQEAPLAEVGGKRLFVKEIEDALTAGFIDLAVHSSKDMPAVLPDGLTIAAVLPREDPLDALVLPASRQEVAAGRSSLGIDDVGDLASLLGPDPSLGTSSVRRIAQLTRIFPGARFTPIRGNLDTRLRKLDEGQHDGLVLAAAGLRRLGFAARISMTLPASACVPAPGQGIVAIETRADDQRTSAVVALIDDPAAAAALRAERAVVERLGGGCQTPIGALATTTDALGLELVAAVVALDGSRAIRGRARGTRAQAVALGVQVAEQLLEQGAGEILAAVRGGQSPVVSVKSTALTDE